MLVTASALQPAPSGGLVALGGNFQSMDHWNENSSPELRTPHKVHRAGHPNKSSTPITSFSADAGEHCLQMSYEKAQDSSSPYPLISCLSSYFLFSPHPQRKIKIPENKGNITLCFKGFHSLSRVLHFKSPFQIHFKFPFNNGISSIFAFELCRLTTSSRKLIC